MYTRTTSVLILAAALSATAFASLSATDQLPQPLARPSPAYPFDLRKSQKEGEVLLNFIITSEGRVADLAVVKSSNWVFRDLALAAVKNWRYTPALKDGHPVSVKVSQHIVFEVPAKDVERAAALAAAKHKAGPAAIDLASSR
jgi:protein TonB